MTLKELIVKLQEVDKKYGDDDPDLLEEFYIGVNTKDGFSHVYLEDIKSLSVIEDDNASSVLICFESKDSWASEN
jgi:hypothetical protein